MRVSLLNVCVCACVRACAYVYACVPCSDLQFVTSNIVLLFIYTVRRYIFVWVPTSCVVFVGAMSPLYRENSWATGPFFFSMRSVLFIYLVFHYLFISFPLEHYYQRFCHTKPSTLSPFHDTWYWMTDMLVSYFFWRWWESNIAFVYSRNFKLNHERLVYF